MGKVSYKTLGEGELCTFFSMTLYIRPFLSYFFCYFAPNLLINFQSRSIGMTLRIIGVCEGWDHLTRQDQQRTAHVNIGTALTARDKQDLNSLINQHQNSTDKDIFRIDSILFGVKALLN